MERAREDVREDVGRPAHWRHGATAPVAARTDGRAARSQRVVPAQHLAEQRVGVGVGVGAVAVAVLVLVRSLDEAECGWRGRRNGVCTRRFVMLGRKLETFPPRLEVSLARGRRGRDGLGGRGLRWTRLAMLLLLLLLLVLVWRRRLRRARAVCRGRHCGDGAQGVSGRARAGARGRGERRPSRIWVKSQTMALSRSDGWVWRCAEEGERRQE